MNYITPRLDRKRDSAEYQRLHKWVYKNLGKARVCSKDPSHIGKLYNWANVSRQYKYDLSDWEQLCVACHRKLDGRSDEFRNIKRLQAIGNTNTARPVSCLELGLSWDSLKHAAEDLKIGMTGVNNCLNGRSKTSANYHWKFARI